MKVYCSSLNVTEFANFFKGVEKIAFQGILKDQVEATFVIEIAVEANYVWVF